MEHAAGPCIDVRRFASHDQSREVVDEAHSNGLYRPKGSGLVRHWGLADQVAILTHTFGKAVGRTGAVVLCHPAPKLPLFNCARSFIVTTGPTFMDLAAVRADYRPIESAEGDRVKAPFMGRSAAHGQAAASR
ncbi:hypothetical protein HRG_014289 [Hirsutella rhossiliensis]